MPRRKRDWSLGGVYHITHRCHEKNFLLKFAKYRDLYLDYLHEATKKFRLKILDYAITSNHVHLLVYVSKGAEISKALQYVHGRIAQAYNSGKKREGAFWKDRFHATRIQEGEHFGKCLFYIDMNMVRAGVVESPMEWAHNGCREFFYEKERKRIVDMEYLLKALRIKSLEKFRKWYKNTLREKLGNRKHAREAFWSRAFAVGDVEWLSALTSKTGVRLKLQQMGAKKGQISFLIGKN